MRDFREDGVGNCVMASMLACLGFIFPLSTMCPRWITKALPNEDLARLMVSPVVDNLVKRLYRREMCLGQDSEVTSKSSR